MAYDASGNKENSQQIAGSAPLSQGGQAPAAQNPQGDSATPQGPSTPATVQTGASVNQAASQGQSQNKSAPKASSGMFTNIQKYVQKNQPQAQQMSQAVTEDFGKKAAEIRKATQEKQQQQQQAIQGGTQAMQSQMEEAQGLVSGIMGNGQQAPAVDPKAGESAAPVDAQAAPTVDEEQAKRFQELMAGPQVGQVADLNLAQQNMRSQALQNLAQGAMGEQGRRNLMKDTFGDRAYSRGQSSLDNLILSGDAGARESLISGVGGESQQLQQDMKGISQEQAQALGEYRQSMGDFGGQVEGLATGAQGEIDTDLEAQRKALMEQYGFGAEGGELADLQMQAAQQFGEGLNYATEDDFYKGLMDQFTPKWSKGGNRDWQDVASIRAMLDPNVDLKQELINRGVYSYNGEGEDTRDLSNVLTLGHGSTGQARIQNMFDNLLQDASNYGLDTDSYRKQLQSLGTGAKRSDLYGFHGHTKGSKSGLLSYDANKFKDTISNLYKDIGSAKENALTKLVENKYKDQGISGEDFLSGQFLDKQGLATQDQADKMLALQNLMGRETNMLGLTPDGQVGQDTAFLEQLRQDLAGSQPQVRTGGTGGGRGLK